MHCDLIIVGGGLVGASLAVALRDTPLNMTLVDARLPTCQDPRLFALNHSSCQFLKNLGLWDALEKQAAPIHHVHVSRAGHFGAVRLQKEDVALPDLGHVIPAYEIERVFAEQFNQLERLTLLRPATVQTITQHNQSATLNLIVETQEKSIEAPVVMDASGTDSIIRQQLNIGVESFDYHQSALVTRTTLQRSHHNIAYERFLSQGAIAMLPLKGNECATIWSADTDTITELAQLSDNLFLEMLQKKFGYRLGRLLSIGKRHVYPLRGVCAEKMVDENVFLLGNSAHTLHPIAAQGLNLALYEVASIVERIKAILQSGRMINKTDLQIIATQSSKQREVSVNVSHYLPKIFSNKVGFLNSLLQIGMIGLDCISPIKQKFISEMLGLAGPVPRLLLSAKDYE